MNLNDAGKIVEDCWIDLPNHYHNLKLDDYTIMRNHIHIIMTVEYQNINDTGLRPVFTIQSKFHGIPEFMRALKSFSSRRINEQLHSKYPPIWQSNYYENIIRNEKSLYEIRKYIQNNPFKWEDDEYYVQ